MEDRVWLRGAPWHARWALAGFLGACAAVSSTGQRVVDDFIVPRSCGEVLQDLGERVRACFAGEDFPDLALDVDEEPPGLRGVGRVTVRSRVSGHSLLVADTVCREDGWTRVSVSSATHPDWRRRAALARPWARGEAASCP